MQQIKFRVWDGVLHEYRTIDMNSGKQNLGMGFESAEGVGGNTTTIYCSFGDVVEQFTGLKDVNGKEIYEGDIIEFFGANKKIKVKKEFGIIVYKADRYGAGFNSIIQNKERGYGGINIAQDIVVGNVHENPKLLEADNE
ncbi:YopX family protein [Companilactobacillus mishanensis]|uniref:YopX family protein n=1 Tax=Companilactobacillus mishanensis TaxID=2486008 RepID=UPI000F7753A9|nr:YopX family protein [Companilactobacillus mishanensis]